MTLLSSVPRFQLHDSQLKSQLITLTALVCLAFVAVEIALSLELPIDTGEVKSGPSGISWQDN
jgi:hypothetical protein